MNNLISQKGAVSIILAVLLLSILLIISLGISVLMIQQIEMSGQASRSVVAYYAAEAGAERCLYQTRCINLETPTAECIAETGPGLDQACASINGVTSSNLDNGATYQATRESDVSITSIGQFRGTNRKVELDWSP